ncbi:MAG: Arsenate-mycothiol transferase ArsC1 [Acidimicrobiales bacterium AG-410-I20]|nr:MAG: Arsenate-mycothiol transferase ArsC1 [Acidimicrobiales bacterium AG-410-I20]
MTKKPSVLFLCVHNAGRSQIAAGWMRHLAGEAIQVYSAGSSPAKQINPAAAEAMSEVGIDITTQQPEKWTDEIVREVDAIISMGCGDTCPVYPGKQYIDWEIQDPAGQGIEMVRTVRDQIKQHVQELIVELLPKKI